MGDTKPESNVVFHIALEVSDCDEPFVRQSSENGEIGRAVDSRRWPGVVTQSTLRLPVGEREALWEAKNGKCFANARVNV